MKHCETKNNAPVSHHHHDPRAKDDHGHAHGLSRSDELVGVSDARLLWAVGLNHCLTVAEVIAAVFSGSAALLSDAAHNFNDANALLIAYIARRVSRKVANERYTFGYRRAEMIGALINLTLLAVIGLYLVYEGVTRLLAPTEITGWLMAVAAALALIIDLATAILLWSMSKGSLNVRAAFIHNVVDALGSVAVLAGAAAVIWLDWNWVDPVITLVIAAFVLWQVIKMFPQATRVLMEGSPVGIDLDDVTRAIEDIEGVDDVHHLHIWELDEQDRALEMHVEVSSFDPGQLELIKRRVKDRLRDRFHISHSTLELEWSDGRAGVCGACEMGRE
jgi:cobalt-zinc-cadmium efflux system protein